MRLFRKGVPLVVLVGAIALVAAAVSAAREPVKTGIICDDVASGCVVSARSADPGIVWTTSPPAILEERSCGPSCIEVDGKKLTVVFPRGAFVDYGVTHKGVVTVKAPIAKVYWSR